MKHKQIKHGAKVINKVKFEDGTFIYVKKMKVGVAQKCDSMEDMSERCNNIVLNSYCDKDGKPIYETAEQVANECDEDIWYAVIEERHSIRKGKKKIDLPETK